MTAAFGFGALAPARIRSFTPRRAVGATGLLLMGCTFLLLKAHGGSAAGKAGGVAAAITAGVAAAALGGAASVALGSAFRSGRHAGNWALAAGAFGAPAGLYAASLSLLPIGANAALMSLGALLVAAAAGHGLLVLGILAFSGPWLTVGDAALERLRSAPRYGMSVAAAELFSSAAISPTDRAWGQSGLVELFIGPNGSRLFANHLQISGVSRIPFLARWKTGERLLVIGAAGGVKANGLCPNCPMTLVDINEATIAVYARHPEVNGNVYLRSEVVAADGRNVLESRPPDSFDTVYFEFADSGRLTIGGMSHNSSLITEGAVDALDRILAPDGQVVYAANWPQLTLPFAAALRRRGWDVDVGVRRLVAARKNVGQLRLGRVLFVMVAAKPGAVRRVGIHPGWLTLAPAHYRMPEFRDGSRWDRMELLFAHDHSRRLRAVLIAVLGAGFLAYLLASPSTERARGTVYFARWGALHALLTPAAFFCLRFRLGENIWSGWIVACAMGAVAGLGALAFGWTSWRRGALVMGGAAALVGIAVAAGPALHTAGPWAVIFGFLPAAILSGFAFPYGLEKFPATSLAAALPWCCGVLLLAALWSSRSNRGAGSATP